MKITTLIFREIRHRRLNFCMQIGSISMAVATLICAMTLLRVDDVETTTLLEERESDVKTAGAELEDAMRKITKGLGFNAVILPADQDVHEMQVEGTFSKSMPYEFAKRLANSDIVTINHLLPTVSKKMIWPETDLNIVLYGTSGEVPLLHRDPKKPLLDSVPVGSMVIGYHIAQKLDLQIGKKTTLLGREFEVIKTHGERGTIDDSTVWINLAEAQELLDMKNLVHAIQALECHCAGDRISQIREEITAILPGTQVIELGDRALARAEARNTAHETAVAAFESEKLSRSQLKDQRESFSTWLVSLMLGGVGIWVGLLAIGNVRQRRQEIAILRAIGLRSSQVMIVFLGKAFLAGVVGSVSGLLLGLGLGVAFNGSSDVSVFATVDATLLVTALVLAPVLALLGSWFPALSAASQDPAVVLQEE